jgi:hypothetical protein
MAQELALAKERLAQLEGSEQLGSEASLDEELEGYNTVDFQAEADDEVGTRHLASLACHLINQVVDHLTYFMHVARRIKHVSALQCSCTMWVWMQTNVQHKQRLELAQYVSLTAADYPVHCSESSSHPSAQD